MKRFLLYHIIGILLSFGALLFLSSVFEVKLALHHYILCIVILSLVYSRVWYRNNELKK